MLSSLIVSAVCLVSQAPEVAKAEDPAYAKALEKRASLVLDELRIEDKAVADRVRRAVLAQYRGLHDIQVARDVKLGDLKGQAERIEAERSGADAAARELNDRYLAGLGEILTPGQVDTVRDVMTYHKLQVTYNGYLDMLPKLTEPQKKRVFDTLKEARDRATYAESAEAKTAIFDKAKGRANNFLSSEGYDLKLASKEWAERRKAAGK